MNNNENVSDQPDEERKCVARLASLIEDQTYIPELISIKEVLDECHDLIFSDILQTRSFTKKHLGKIGFSVDRTYLQI